MTASAPGGSPRGSPIVGVVTRSIAALARAQLALTRTTSNAMDALGGVAIYALHEPELDRLAASIYDHGPLHRGERVEDWEARWWTSALPKTPGRILVAGCGAGRELTWLLQRGWTVHGFDPAESLVALARERLRKLAAGDVRERVAASRVDVLDFAGFIRALDARADLAIGAGAGAGAFDAVLLGWGSFSHCLSDVARRQLIRACDDVCPRGPILLSWHGAEAAIPAGRRRARVLGTRVGRAIGALRGLPTPDAASWRESVLLLPHAGPLAFLEEAEVRSLASTIRRQVVYDGEVMPHAALVAAPRAAKFAKATERLKRADHARAIDEKAIELLADVLSTQGRHRVIAHGGSMKPAIAPGSAIDIEPPGTIAIGDVVAVRFHGSLLVHRVVGVDAQGQLLLKGDACDAPDGWIPPRAVLGRVAFIDDGRGRHAVPLAAGAGGPSLLARRWRGALGRLQRAARAIRS